MLCLLLGAGAWAQQSEQPVREPGWFLAPTYPDPGGRMPVGHGGQVLSPQSGGGLMAGCADDITRICTTGQTGTTSPGYVPPARLVSMARVSA
jgi:hypothetical protein